MRRVYLFDSASKKGRLLTIIIASNGSLESGAGLSNGVMRVARRVNLCILAR